MEPVVVLGLVVALLVVVGVVLALRRQASDPPPARAALDTAPFLDPPPARAGRRADAVDEDTRTDQLLDELAEIGRTRGFLHAAGKDTRTREIGAELNRMNGKQKMLDAHAVVAAELGRLHARELEAAWDGVGDWRG